MDTSKYNVADISKEILSQITNLEKQLRQETGDEIILIAYEDQVQ